MTETEYVRVTNRVKISIALEIIRDVLGSIETEDFGITDEDLATVRKILRSAEVRLFGDNLTVGKD